jgi:ATP-dependent protease Clp ATPase subunit
MLTFVDILGFRAFQPACSFCGRRPGAANLVEGPGVRICGDCVGWCTEVLEERRQAAAEIPAGAAGQISEAGRERPRAPSLKKHRQAQGAGPAS